MWDIVILASCEHDFIRVHENLVQNSSNNKYFKVFNDFLSDLVNIFFIILLFVFLSNTLNLTTTIVFESEFYKNYIKLLFFYCWITLKVVVLVFIVKSLFGLKFNKCKL